MPPKVVAVIPAFRTPEAAIEVVREALEKFDAVIVVDDACPEESGKKIEAAFPSNDRLTVLFNKVNLGVGGAMKVGIQRALAEDAQLLVKIDSDGQMDLTFADDLLAPLRARRFDMAKGNRFSSREHLLGMPPVRLFGNSILTFMSRLSTGLWNISDPTNGFFAITSEMARKIPWSKISDRYLFESELLFRAGIGGFRVVDIAMPARYLGERSSLRPIRLAPKMAFMHVRHYFKRIAYQYFVFEINPGTFYLVFGNSLIVFGLIFGALNWNYFSGLGQVASAGTVGISLLSSIIGFQLILQFISFDTARRGPEL